MPPLSVPTSSALPPSLRIPPTDSLIQNILGKLSRPTILSLVLDWLDERNLPLTAPYLASPDDTDDDLYAADLYPPLTSLADLREHYISLQSQRGTRRALVDRLLEGDYRHGLSLYQIAMADLALLYTQRTSKQWSAYALTPQHPNCPPIPPFHPPTFLSALQRALPPDIKAHYNFDRPPGLPLLLLRILLLDTPYSTNPSLQGAKVVYIAFPDASPHLFISASLPTTTAGERNARDTHSNLRQTLISCLPTALSRPRARYTLSSTNLSARTLKAMLELRGGGRTGNAQGGWGAYAVSGRKAGDTPLEPVAPALAGSNRAGGEENHDPREKNGENKVGVREKAAETRGMKRPALDDRDEAKRRRLLAAARFGPVRSAALERVDVRIDDPFSGASSSASQGTGGEGEGGGGEEEWCPSIRVSFRGSDVFRGIRRLVERGVVDGVRMPGWMSGEAGVSVGVVKGGRLGG